MTLSLDTSWAYRGLGRNHIVGFGLVVAQSLFLLGAYFFVEGPLDLVRVPLLQFAGEIVPALILLAILFNGPAPRPSLSRGLALLGQSGFITHAVFLPAVTRAAFSGPIAIGPVVTRSLNLSSSVILPMAAGGIVLAGPLLAFMFGNEYAAGARAFQILLASIALLALHGSTHNVFVALDRSALEAGIFGVAAGLNVVLNLLLIPRYGLVGAASATLAAEGLILLAAATALYRLGVRMTVDGVLRPLAAAAAMAASLFPLVDRVHVMILVGAGAAIYVGLLAISGGFPREFSEPVMSPEV